MVTETLVGGCIASGIVAAIIDIYELAGDHPLTLRE
jgi:hypothetical protein